MIKKYAIKLFNDWGKRETKKFISLIDKSNSIVDLGCGDGELSLKFAEKAGAKKLIGLDSFILNRNFKVIKTNLNKKFPLQSDKYDAVLSHFSLEHLYNTGMFVSESKRILKKGGYTLVATDNMSSWANVISLLLGFQPFSTTNGMSAQAIGNPFALRTTTGEIKDKRANMQWRESGEFSHNKVLSYKALVDVYKEYGFKIEKVVGIGYLPFIGSLSKILANFDKRHAHFLILKATKV